MNKKIYTTILVSSFYLLSMGQTLTSNIANVIGDVATFKDDNQTLAPGSSGQSQTWDFSSVVVNTPNITETYMAPSSTPYASLFPGSNLATFNSSSSQYLYLTNTANDFIVTGIKDPTFQANFSNGQTFMSTPASYNTAYTDSFYSSLILTGAGTTTMSGVINSTIDGTGTLILPNITYNNAMRRHITSSQNIVGFGITSNDNYEWFVPNVKGSVFAIKSSTNQNGNTTHSIRYFVQSTTGIESSVRETQSFDLFPNPTSSNATMQLNLTQTSDVLLKVFNDTGELIEQSIFNRMPQGKFTQDLNTSNYPKGMYMVCFSTNGHKCTRKLLVE